MVRLEETTMKTAAGLMLAAGLLGCATPSYQPPADGPKARITIVNESGGRTDMALYRNAADCRNRELIRPFLEPGASRTVEIATTGQATLSMFQDTGVSVMSAGPTGAAVAITGCSPTLTFAAEAGGEYLVRFHRQGSSCTTHITQTGQGGAALPEPLTIDYRVRNYAAAFDDSGSFCRD